MKLITKESRKQQPSFLRGSLLVAVIALFSVTLLRAQTFTFTHAGATGQNGPSQALITSAYTNTSLAGKVLAVNGIQYWIVPQTGLYSIQATGAEGYGTYGGRGAYMSGEFLLYGGDTLKIIVGQRGAPPVGAGTNQYGGGGGSFVARINNTPILVAGGGGGSWASSFTSTTDASLTTSGNTGANGPTNGAGGTNGSGGGVGATSGGGGGFTGDGATGVYAGLAFINGGRGGRAATNGGEGGFGGGGGADSWDNRRCGGGGGYSGGGGAGSTTTLFPEGGGGGSYNSGNNKVNTAGIGTGDGIIVIKVLSSGATNDMGVISIDSPTVYCSGIHNVVATVQNFGINRIDSVTLNWSVKGVLQTPVYYAGTIDTIGGQGSPLKQITLGSYNFNSSSHVIRVWTSKPNGGTDTVKINDTASATKQVNLPPPTGLTAMVLNPTNSTIGWNGGSASNTWAYVNSLTSVTPTGPGTIVTKDSVYITGLSEKTNYYFYVREICASGDSSTWAGPLLYRTPCITILNGAYTINPAQAASATNFVSFTTAVSDLLECGVSGPVEFRVAPGTYTGRVILTQIPGASATNTITFIGSGIGSTILTNAGSSTANWSTVYLNGSDYVGFRDMTIRATNATNAIGVHMTNQADYNRFDNLRIEMNATATGTSVWGISGSGSATSVTTAGDACNHTWIDSITVTGGYGGVSIYGTGTSTAHSFGNRVTNSTFTSLNTYGIRFYYQNDLELDNNKITNFRSATGYGLYVYYCSDFLITNNEVVSPYLGLYLYYGNYYLASGTFESMVYNNLLTGGSYYTLYQYYSNEVNFYHNTLSGAYTTCAYFYNNVNLDCRNNIFVNTNTSATGYVVYIYSGSQTYFDHNIYSGKGGSFIYHDVAYADFASWRQDFPFLNEKSQVLEPSFAGTNDLRLDHSASFPRGVNLGITHDVDGDERCGIVPTIGADESEYVNPSPTAGIVASDSIYVSSPTTFFSAYQPVVNALWDYTWYVDDVQASTNLDFIKVFGTTGTYEVKLRARSCSGSDRDSILVTVIDPTSTPLTDFTASKLVLDMLEPSVLSDLSDFGPTQWEWTAEPSADAFFTDAFASNPTVYFLNPGEFKICLTTANNLGFGTTLCKTAYIQVNEDVILCSNTETVMPAGRLTDEGGVNGNYSANSNCNYHIHPCAGEVTLRFTQWNLTDADDLLRVYDGDDNTGTLLGTFNSNSNIPGGANGLVASTGKMYLEWRTSPAGQSSGFTAYWTSKPDLNMPVPVANFNIPDTIFTDQVVTFTSTSTGSALKYAWDFDPPFAQAGLEGGKKEFDQYSWGTAGTYQVQLTVTNCGGTNDVIKNVQVIDPTSKPVVDFTADRTKVPVLTTVTLRDASFQGGTSWKWTVTPANTAILLTPDNGKELKVSFIKNGKYTVKLKVTNSLGSDSLVKVEYIEVFDYCAPVVGNVSSDVGISRVQFKGIDNYSAAGANKYTSYLNTLTPEVVSLRESVSVRVERQSTIDPLNRKVWVDWNNDGDFDDAGEEVGTEASSRTQNFTTTFGVPNTANIGYTTLRVGVSYDNDPNKPCGINPTGEFEDYPIQVIQDMKPPVISLIGLDSVWVEKGYQYLDAGAVAMDNVDGNLTSIMITSNPVDSTVVGTYVVRYNVSDLDGNDALEVTRIVIVTPDVTAPVITLNGSASVNVTVGTNYTDAGATAEDYFQHDLTPQMQFGDNIDLGVLGTYYNWYRVEDASGNKDSVARVVNVIDDILPVLTLLGDNPLVVEVKTALTDPGYTVTDNFDANPMVTINVTQVKMNQLGLYPMTYTAADASGNVTVVTRMISVEDNTGPVVKLIGRDTIVVDVFDSYNEQGVQVQDNFCTGLTWDVDQQPNTSVLGDYTLTYTSTDCNANISAGLTRVVRVVDREAPVLTLNGFAANTIYRWQTYTDPGVSIDDNYYSEATLQDSVKVTGNFDPNWVGFYSMCYTVTDPSGNKSTTVCRSIRVLESITSLDDTKTNRYNIYPNPSNGAFTLSFGEVLTQKATIKIYDMAGKVVAEMEVVPGTLELPVQLDLAEGVYRVAVSSDSYQQVLSIQVAP